MDANTNKDKTGSQPVEVEKKEENPKINHQIIYVQPQQMVCINQNQSPQQGKYDYYSYKFI